MDRFTKIILVGIGYFIKAHSLYTVDIWEVLEERKFYLNTRFRWWSRQAVSCTGIYTYSCMIFFIVKKFFFKDHGKLYNELYSNFKDMRQSLNDFKGKFVQETAGIPVIADCLKVLSARCGKHLRLKVALVGGWVGGCVQ